MVIDFDGEISPGASIFAGATRFARCWEAVGGKRGDRIVYHGPKCANFVKVLVGCILADAQFCPISEADWQARGELFDSQCHLVLSEQSFQKGLKTGSYLRRSERDQFEPSLFFIGSHGEACQTATFPYELVAIYVNHLVRVLGIPTSANVLATQEWDQGFGLICELLTALISRANIQIVLIDQEKEKPISAMILETFSPWIIASAATLDMILSQPKGFEALSAIAGGIIDCTQMSPQLSKVLEKSRHCLKTTISVLDLNSVRSAGFLDNVHSADEVTDFEIKALKSA